MRDILKFLVLLIAPITIFGAEGDLLDQDTFVYDAAAFADRVQQGTISWTATEASDPTKMNVSFIWTQTGQVGNRDYLWSVGARVLPGGTPSQGYLVSQPTDTFSLLNVLQGTQMETGLTWISSPQQQFNVQFTPDIETCDDIDISTTITNTGSSPRTYYWEMNDGLSGWVPASTPDHGAWGDIVLGAGESMDISMILTADQNPDCAEFALRSCNAFNSAESPDSTCGQVEYTVDPNSETIAAPTADGPASFGPGTFDNDGTTAAFDTPDISPDPADLATTTGQEVQIQAAQALARWQAIQNYNNTQNIVTAVNNLTLDGATVEVDLGGVETRIDQTNVELATVNTSLDNIESAVEQEFDTPSLFPSDQTESLAAQTDFTDSLTETTNIINDTIGTLPPTPIIPTTIGTKSTLTIDFGGWKNFPPFDIDFAVYTTEINFFRAVMTWFIYVFTWFVLMKIIRGAFAG